MGADLTTGAGTSAGKNGFLFSHTQLSANTHTQTRHPLRTIKYMTNSNPDPSGDFVHDVLMLVVVEFIWECLPSVGAVTHPACIQQ